MEKIGIYNSKKRALYLKEVLKKYSSGVPIADICEQTGVGKTAIYDWIRNFAAESQPSDANMRKKTIQEPKSITPEELAALSPEKQVAYLKEALRKAELRADAYDTMIEIAESKFKIPIRKKAGVKQ